MEFGGEKSRVRMVGDYIIGPKIGSGSFAVVWRSKHRHLGTEFAIKEIDKRQINDSLLKEIEILRNIDHPNIIRLFEAIETEEKIFLVLEYCDGGDLGVYINKHGRVSEDVARHFLKQLAAGLQVLRMNHLIHRDLKPQNLLLSGKEVTPMLKIGDFGFARYLNSQGLADTLCGSPLYMAPEIIQNQKYDAKADLWSVGAILYQLVIGKPPFDGNSQLQLFQNILKSSELRFPEGALRFLHPECMDLCRCLLRKNPVERLTFEEFFDHKFLTERRVAADAESSLTSRVQTLVLTDGQRPIRQQGDTLKAPDKTLKQYCSPVNDERRAFGKDHSGTSSGRDVCGVTPNIFSENFKQSIEGSPLSISQTRVADSLDAIEREYVLVHSNFASMEILTSSLGTSLKENSTTKPCTLAPKNSEQPMPIMPEITESRFNSGTEIFAKSGKDLSTTSNAPRILKEAQGLPILHPSTRLQLLHQYLGALSDLALEKFNAGSFLESFSVELVVLALWKEAFRICSHWLSSGGISDLLDSSLGNTSTGVETTSSSSKTQDCDFTDPASVSSWTEQGFIAACDRTEKLSKYLQDVDGTAEMPNAIEIIFQTALATGRTGAADELLGNRSSAEMMYSKALLLLSFIVTEAPSLPLNPPYSIAPDDKSRLLKYIKNLESHLSQMNRSQMNRSQMSLPSQSLSFLSK